MENKIKFYKLEDAVNYETKKKTVFILANDYKKSNSDIGRFFYVFPSFSKFLQNRDKYPHCHEILVDHHGKKPDPRGRLVFDFDIEDKTIIPKRFKMQIEGIIIDVCDDYFENVDTNILEFVWSTSLNPNKFSKHLTVKNIYFDNWIELSKIFYSLFSKLWDKKYDWIHSSKICDHQIIRKKGTLRMVGSSKIDGSELILDNDEYELTDSLIRIYFKEDRKQEQLITSDNIKNGVFENVLEIDIEQYEKYKYPNLMLEYNKERAYDVDVYENAYGIVNRLCPGIFKSGKITGRCMNLNRIKSARCLMSGKIHDAENAFLLIIVVGEYYVVKYGCYRYCHKIKVTEIGTIGIDDKISIIHYNFEYLVNKKNHKYLIKY